MSLAAKANANREKQLRQHHHEEQQVSWGASGACRRRLMAGGMWIVMAGLRTGKS